MINKFKYLFLMILCVGVISGTSEMRAQTGAERVLVAASGNSLTQADIDRVIEFYEWAFAAKMTQSERDQYRAIKVAEFRNNPIKAKKGNDELGGYLNKIRTNDEARQEVIRKSFLESFVPDLRKSTDDPEAVFLIEILDGTNGSSASAIDQGQSQAGDGDISNLSGLAGKWVWGRSGSTTYNTGGAMLGSNGSRHTYQFSANGAVEYTGIMNVMTGGCNMQIFRTAKGRASLNGSTLTINWAPAKFTRDDSCSPSKNYTKTLPEETEKFQINFKSDYGQKQLCLFGKEETCYSQDK